MTVAEIVLLNTV